MKTLLPIALVFTVSGLAAAPQGWVGDAPPHAEVLAAAVTPWMESLPEDLRSRVALPFDDPYRHDWHYVPRERKGISLAEMAGEPRLLFDAVLQKALSGTGYSRVHGVLLLEEELGRDPLNYWVTVFGDPSSADPWGLRFEGHHLSLNFTVQKDRFVNATPLMIGSQPAVVLEGPRAGFKLLWEEEAMARDLVAGLDARQRLAAVRSVDPEVEGSVAFRGDVYLAPGTRENFEQLEGLSPRSMTFAQRFQMMGLLTLHASVLPHQVYTAALNRYRANEINDIAFLWIGSETPGDPFYYRISSLEKKFAVEFHNRGGDHIHTVWRDFSTDFGGL